MAELRATQFYKGNVTTVTPSWATLYTVPAGHRIILRSITMRNASASNNTVRIAINSSINLTTHVLGSGAGDTGSYEWLGWTVLDAGDVLVANVSLVAGAALVVSGSYHYV